MGEWMLGEGRRERRDESVSINLYKLYGMHCALDDLIACYCGYPVIVSASAPWSCSGRRKYHEYDHVT